MEKTGKMATKYIKMTDCDRCLICGKHIGLGNDPAVCSEKCLYWLDVEMEFNKWAKQQTKGAVLLTRDRKE